MKLLFSIVMMCFFTLGAQATSSGNSVGIMRVFNNDLHTGVTNALENFEALFPQTGFVRVKVRQMLEALQGNKRNGRAFNPGIISHNDGYLLTVRVLHHADNYFEEIVPGNRVESKYEKGKNFWWQDFSSSKFTGGTLYFHVDSAFKEFSLLIPSNYNSNFEMISGSDMRLLRTKKGDIATFTPKASPIAVTLQDHKLLPGLSMGIFNFGRKMANAEIGNNFGAIDIDFDSNHYSYIDWFFKEGVRFAKATAGRVNYDHLAYVDNEFPVLGGGSSLEDGGNAGLNSGIMPLFSLGSSHLQLDEQTYLGVGHTKIYVDEETRTYVEGSNIDLFRKKLTKNFTSLFGKRYIRHDAYNSNLQKSQGYHYLMYFYTFKLNQDGKPVEMKISDSYLPIDIGEAQKPTNYVFSLVFPMGVTNKIGDKNTMVISAGIGDYYAALIELPIQFVADLCRHDITNLNMKNYEYKIMRFDGKGNLSLIDALN